jgi:hypothetical protein
MLMAFQLNPDHYTLWNFRREIITAMLEQHAKTRVESRDSAGDADKADQKPAEDFNHPGMLAEELRLSVEAIKRNPKSCVAQTPSRDFTPLLNVLLFCVRYNSWHHRKWALGKCSEEAGTICPSLWTLSSA